MEPEATMTGSPTGPSSEREALALQRGKARLLQEKLQQDIVGMKVSGLKPLFGIFVLWALCGNEESDA